MKLKRKFRKRNQGNQGNQSDVSGNSKNPKKKLKTVKNPRRKKDEYVSKTIVLKKYMKKRCGATTGAGTQCKKKALEGDDFCATHGGVLQASKEGLIDEKKYPYLLNKTKYDPDYHPEKYLELSSNGYSDVEIAAEFDVSVPSITEWSEKYLKFNACYEAGKAKYEAWWLREGKSGLRDRRFNTVLYKFLTGNKLGYTDRIESKNLNMNVNGVLVVPGSKSIEEWEADTVQEAEIVNNHETDKNP
jgi:hypothetical protein